MSDINAWFNIANITTTTIKNTVDIVKSVIETFPTKRPQDKKLIDTSLETIGDQTSKMLDTYLQAHQLLLKISESNQALIAKNNALSNENAALIKENSQLKQFSIDEALFEKVALAQSSVAWRFKATSSQSPNAPSQPINNSELFCADCFDKKIIARLYFESHETVADRFKCPTCATFVYKPREPDRIRAIENSRTHNFINGYRFD